MSKETKKDTATVDKAKSNAKSASKSASKDSPKSTSKSASKNTAKNATKEEKEVTPAPSMVRIRRKSNSSETPLQEQVSEDIMVSKDISADTSDNAQKSSKKQKKEDANENTSVNTTETDKKCEDSDSNKTKQKTKSPKKTPEKVTDAPARIVKPVDLKSDNSVTDTNESSLQKSNDQDTETSSEKISAQIINISNESSKEDTETNTPETNLAKQSNQEEKSIDKDDLKTKETDEHDANKIAPAASAKPDFDSSKSILPPAGSKTTRVNHAETTENEDDKSGHVRVISRPAVNTARVIEKVSPYTPSNDNRRNNNQGGHRGAHGGSRDSAHQGNGQTNSSGRDGNRPPYAGQGANRDNNRPPFDKDAPQTKGPRPQQKSSSPRSSADAPFAMPMENDQSRKKRNKGGRRTVEFGQSESQENFRRRSIMNTGTDDDENFRHRRSRKPKKQQQAPQSTQPMKAAKRKVRFEEAIRVADIAHQMSVKASEVIKVLFNLGVMATINNALDIDTATLIASEFGYELEKFGFSEDNYLQLNAEDTNQENQKPRPPVVTIMGHVDHGKTSLLDAIRKTSVATGEAGGITQYIGAYNVSTKRGDIVFLDTPGHEAFTSMRARGAQVTDLVVLVVAADDGVMEQTREAVNHSKAAGVPILVAVNKIDKEGANPERVVRELAELGLQAEEWGGDTVFGYVSAKTRQGLDDLLELIALQAEVMELKANKDKAARGRVVEAKLDKGRGPVATVLIQEGTLHQGDAFVCGVFAGRVRAFFNDQGRKIKEAGPSIPVEIQGFDGVPEAGEEFICLADEKTARKIADARAIKQRERELAKASRVTLETFLASTPSDAEAQVLNLVLKADVQGSLEAITDALHKLSTEKVRISVIHSGAGAITETDIMLAAASHGIIIGFNVRPTAKVKDVAEQEMVDIRFYDIIYKLVEEIRSAMAGLLAPVKRESYLGQAEVRQAISVPKVGVVAGCMVNDGKVVRNSSVRILRDGIVVYTGKIGSLRRMKDDVKEVTKGFECGIVLENFNDIKEADIIECFEMIEEAAVL